MFSSLNRSVTMDKWKESELNKMKVGGNRRAKSFLEGHTDWNSSAPITAKYNSRAAALYKDKILVESQGGSWSEETSSAKNHKSSYVQPSGGGGGSSRGGGGMKASQSFTYGKHLTAGVLSSYKNNKRTANINYGCTVLHCASLCVI